MRYFTSDTHFSHQRIIELCDRPFTDYHHMNEVLIKNWNSVVGLEDEVFHLGDVALGPWVEWNGILTRLNGYKNLIIGNHDRIFAGNNQKTQDRFIGEYNKWFGDYYDNISRNFTLSDGTRVNLSHFPYDGDSHDGDRFEEFRLPDDGTVLIHGHTHSNSKVSHSNNGTLQIHVGVDSWEYQPVSEAEVISLIQDNL